MDDGHDPFDIQREIATYSSELDKNDTFFVYFSGHGVVDGGKLYLLLASTELDSMYTTALPASALLDAMMQCKARQRILILDCCNAGQIVREAGLKGGAEDRVLQQDLGLKSDAFDIILASEFLEKTKELPHIKSSVLCESIVSCLAAPFSETDLDGDGAISTDDLMRWIEQFVTSLNTSDESRGAAIPMPKRNGLSRGLNYITAPPKPKSEWKRLPIAGLNDHLMIVLPITFGSSNELIALSEAPTTVGQYMRFVEETGHPEPTAKQFTRFGWNRKINVLQDKRFNNPDNPIVGVNIYDAKAYCEWLSQKSNNDNNIIKRYALPVPDVLEFVERSSFEKFRTQSLQSEPNKSKNQRAPFPIIDSRRSSLGLYSLSGNIWQWTGGLEEWWEYFVSAEVNVDVKIVFGPYTSINSKPDELKVLYGGSFYDLETADRKTFSVENLSEHFFTKQADLGFRVCSVVPIADLQKIRNTEPSSFEVISSFGFYNEHSSAHTNYLGDQITINWNNRPQWSIRTR